MFTLVEAWKIQYKENVWILNANCCLISERVLTLTHLDRYTPARLPNYTIFIYTRVFSYIYNIYWRAKIIQ